MNSSLHLAESFRCRSCGRCCRNSWSVTVEPAVRETLLASAAAHEVARQGYLPLQLLPDQSEATGRRERGECVFLADNALCSLHAELGSTGKPLACRLFPYSVVATPDGHFASLSFACPAVVEGLAGDLEANRRELAELLTLHASSRTAIPEQVAIRAGHVVPWASYRKLEPHLLDAFRPDDPVSSLLDLAVAVLHTCHSPSWPDLSGFRRDEPLEESMLAMFCASVIALWELPEHAEQRQQMSQDVLAGKAGWSHRHHMALPPFEIYRAEPPWLRRVFERYVGNAVFGKALLGGTLVSRLLALAIGSALALYYGEAFARAQGAQELHLEALVRSFELVEADLVSHTQSVDPLFAAFENTLCQVYELKG